MNNIQRIIIEKISPWLDERQYIIIKGARRVGKTFVMKQLQKKIQSPSAFLFCDHLDFLEKISTPNDFIFLLQHKYGFVSGEKFTVFLDEFQSLPQAGLFLKNIYDEYPEIKIIASGSSSLEIQKNTEFLTGRSVEFLMQPLSFLEYFSFVQQKKITAKKTSDEYKQFYKFFQKEIDEALLQYMIWGGYPEVVLQNTPQKKKKLLQEYIEKYIEKDIIHFLKIENISAFNNLLKLTAQQIGEMINTNEISNTLQITNATAKKYLDILEGTYVFSRLKPFFKNVRSEVSKMPKGYYTDLGLRNMILQYNDSLSSHINLGSEAENLVFSKLHESKNPLFFWRSIGGAEIDFIQEKEEKFLDAIEVKYRNSPKLGKGFTSFEKKYSDGSLPHSTNFPNKGNYKKIRKVVITKDQFEEIKGVEHIPLGMFLLME
jgi:predicted AAA+ superfamily ATPase